jgi:environmental stress-induced protein Ves
MRRLAKDGYRPMPWRNGGGTTTEILIAPEGATVASGRFLHRLSIADVATDGPFSRFEGYDRHIMLLSGAGMTLDCGQHGRIELRAPFEPHAFSGDWDVTGTLVAGPVRDLNLMVDRAAASSTFEVRELVSAESIDCELGTTCIAHVIDGELTGAACGDTLVAEAPFELVPLGAARIALARIVPRAR